MENQELSVLGLRYKTVNLFIGCPELSSTEVIAILDSEIELIKREIPRRIQMASRAVTNEIEYQNLFLWAAAITQTAGRIFRQASRSFGVTQLTYPLLLSAIRRAFSGGTYAANRILGLEDSRRTCGQGDFGRTISQYSYLWNVDQLIQNQSIEEVWRNPDYLKFKNVEFGETLKNELSCVIRSGINESANLVQTIDFLVQVMNLRLDETKSLLSERSRLPK